MTLTFENKGAAPFYYDWPLYLYLQDGQGKELKKIEVPLTLSQLVPAPRNGECGLKSLVSRKFSGRALSIQSRHCGPYDRQGCPTFGHAGLR